MERPTRTKSAPKSQPKPKVTESPNKPSSVPQTPQIIKFENADEEKPVEAETKVKKNPDFSKKGEKIAPEKNKRLIIRNLPFSVKYSLNLTFQRSMKNHSKINFPNMEKLIL
jgi:hypothetical protein